MQYVVIAVIPLLAVMLVGYVALGVFLMEVTRDREP